MVRLFIRNGKCGVEEYYRVIGTDKKAAVFLACYEKESISYKDLKQRFSILMDEPALSKILSDFLSEGILEKLIFSGTGSARISYRITQKGADLYPILMLMEQYCIKWQYMYNTETCEWMTFSKKQLGSRWNNRIIWVLYVLRNVRFNDLKGSIEGISFKILAEKLQFLEEEKIVNRKDFNENPPHIEYSLTPKGQDLYDIILRIANWDAQYNRGKIKDNDKCGVQLSI